MKYWYMVIKLSKNLMVIFDLDDTLFSEIDYLKSAYRFIAKNIKPDEHLQLYEAMFEKYMAKENVFQWLYSNFGKEVPGLDVPVLLKWYREHMPEIKLREGVIEFLEELKNHQVPLGLITDGRSISQRNKLKALKIEGFFDDIIISEEFGSEKPDPENYLYFVNKYGKRDYYYIGDNTGKDFLIPARLGWNIICIKNAGANVHSQNFNDFPVSGTIISSLKEITLQ